MRRRRWIALTIAVGIVASTAPTNCKAAESPAGIRAGVSAVIAGTLTANRAEEESAELPEVTLPDATDTWLDAETVQICEEAGREYGIAPELLEAIIEKESSGQQYAENGSCKGLMQIDENLHAERMQSLGYGDIWSKRANIYTGADLLLELCERYGDVGTALMAYNGSSDVMERAERGELTEYAEAVLNRSDELQRVHGK